MMKTLTLSNGSRLNLTVSSDYEHNKRKTDEYEAQLTLDIKDKEILICSDYLNYIISQLIINFNNIENLNLSKIFEKHNIGRAYNDYLHHIDNEQDFNDDYLAEENDVWIGDKHLLFTTQLPDFSATWLYSLNDKYYLEITSLYEKHFLDSDESSYIDFISKYKVLERIELSNQDIENLIKLLKDFV